MYSVNRLDLASLDERTRQKYEKLTSEKYRCCLSGQQPDAIPETKIIAISATLHGEPVGLLLASYFIHVRQADIHSVFVKEDHRHCSVGTQMVQALEIEMLLLKCIKMMWAYPSWEPYAPYIERILKRLNWGAPQHLIIHCRFDSSTFNPAWWQIKYRYSSGFTAFPWKDLTLQERDKIALQVKQGVVPTHVSPFRNEAVLEPLNSLGLRFNGEVVGWMITHRESPDTIRYTALYMQRRYQQKGDAIKLLCDSIRLHIEAKVPWGVLDINTIRSSYRWLKFIERRLIPYAISVTYTNYSWKAPVPRD